MGLISLLKGLYGRIAAWIAPSEAAWKGASRAMLVLFSVYIAIMLVFEVLPDFWIGRFLGLLVSLGMILAVVLGIQLTVWFLTRLPAGFRTALLLAIFGGLFFGLALWGVPKGLLPPILLAVLLSLLFGAAAVLRERRSLVALVIALVSLGGLGLGLFVTFKPAEDINPWIADVPRVDRTIKAENPGDYGTHKIERFTYGSGEDKRRPEYAGGVRFKTPSVDGSRLVDRWEGAVGWARTLYWGFDHKALPVQGRAFMPQGEGPFPLVLMVHGNHGMEDYSDPGYAYLGELFATRGIIAVTVDENFLNGSMVDIIFPPEPGIGRENDARGWMLLKHLEQWRSWNNDPRHELYGKVDLDHMALIGHSRGGEAVAIAAAFNNLPHYPDNADEVFDFGFNLDGVIAIAPADGQYNPRNYATHLRDVNYFTIHGSMDGDVQSFMGASQFSRVELTGDTRAFKASLYIEGANHGQFNTSWGLYDFGLPHGWLFNTKDIMDPEEQRQIARVYFSAFLETVFGRSDTYLPLFADPRNGAAWLPGQYMMANLVTSDRIRVADFEEDLDLTTGSRPDVEIRTRNLTRWREDRVSLKWRKLDTHVALLAWDKEVKEETASFEVSWMDMDLTEDARLVFALSDMGKGTKPYGWEAPEGESEASEEGEEEGAAEADESDADEDDKTEPLDWTVVVVDALGNEARLKLSHDQALFPQVKAHTRKLESLASIAKSELVWRRYEFPLLDFMDDNADFEPVLLTAVRFEFDSSEKGSIAIDDIGLE